MSTYNTSSTHGAPNTAGPHSSDMANKLDPRVDSDLDGSRNLGARHADNFGSTTAGPHSSNVANALDPRVDSDLDGSRNLGAYGTTGTTAPGGGYAAAGLASTGPAPHTAGPHKSDLMNKLDPRVDSDLDGSKTIGGDKSHTASTRY